MCVCVLARLCLYMFCKSFNQITIVEMKTKYVDAWCQFICFPLWKIWLVDISIGLTNKSTHTYTMSVWEKQCEYRDLHAKAWFEKCNEISSFDSILQIWVFHWAVSIWRSFFHSIFLVVVAYGPGYSLYFCYELISIWRPPQRRIILWWCSNFIDFDQHKLSIYFIQYPSLSLSLPKKLSLYSIATAHLLSRYKIVDLGTFRLFHPFIIINKSACVKLNWSKSSVSLVRNSIKSNFML